MKPQKRIPMKDIRIIAEQIAEHFTVEKIILFGSYAYGNPNESSDVDLLVIMNHDKKNNRKQMFEISETLYPKPFSIDVIVRKPIDIKRRIPLGDWFLKQITQQGKILYNRKQTI